MKITQEFVLPELTIYNEITESSYKYFYLWEAGDLHQFILNKIQYLVPYITKSPNITNSPKYGVKIKLIEGQKREGGDPYGSYIHGGKNQDENYNNPYIEIYVNKIEEYIQERSKIISAIINSNTVTVEFVGKKYRLEEYLYMLFFSFVIFHELAHAYMHNSSLWKNLRYGDGSINKIFSCINESLAQAVAYDQFSEELDRELVKYLAFYDETPNIGYDQGLYWSKFDSITIQYYAKIWASFGPAHLFYSLSQGNNTIERFYTDNHQIDEIDVIKSLWFELFNNCHCKPMAWEDIIKINSVPAREFDYVLIDNVKFPIFYEKVDLNRRNTSVLTLSKGECFSNKKVDYNNNRQIEYCLYPASPFKRYIFLNNVQQTDKPSQSRYKIYYMEDDFNDSTNLFSQKIIAINSGDKLYELKEKQESISILLTDKIYYPRYDQKGTIFQFYPGKNNRIIIPQLFLSLQEKEFDYVPYKFNFLFTEFNNTNEENIPIYYLGPFFTTVISKCTGNELLNMLFKFFDRIEVSDNTYNSSIWSIKHSILDDLYDDECKFNGKTYGKSLNYVTRALLGVDTRYFESLNK